MKSGCAFSALLAATLWAVNHRVQFSAFYLF